MKNGIKLDILAALRTAPLQFVTLFPDSVIKRAEEDIAHYDNKGQSASSSARDKGRYHPYERSDKGSESRSDAKLNKSAWKNIMRRQFREGQERLPVIPHDQPRASSRINDNKCVDSFQTRLLAGSPPLGQTINNLLHQNINSPVVKVVHSAPGLSQKKEVSPGMSDCYMKKYKLKYVKSVSCVTQLSCVKPVTNVTTAVPNLPVGARLLANLAGSVCWFESSSNPKRGLYPPLLDPAKFGKVSNSRKLLCQSPQEPVPAGGITSAYRQKPRKQKISGIFQPTIFSTSGGPY